MQSDGQVRDRFLFTEKPPPFVEKGGGFLLYLVGVLCLGSLSCSFISFVFCLGLGGKKVFIIPQSLYAVGKNTKVSVLWYIGGNVNFALEKWEFIRTNK